MSKTLSHTLFLASTVLPGCGPRGSTVTGPTERTVMDERAELAEGKKANSEVLRMSMSNFCIRSIHSKPMCR